MPTSFHLARNHIGHSALLDKRPGHKWVTDLSFDKLRSQISSSFYGNPNIGVDGELCLLWMLNKYLQGIDDQIKSDALTFLLSFPIHEVKSSKGNFLDISIQTPEGDIASTAIVVNYKIRSPLGRLWHFICTKIGELHLSFKLWKHGNLPEIITNPKWKLQRSTLFQVLDNTTSTMQKMHFEKGPKPRHWYINFVATNPNHHNRGYGSQVMAKVCQLADEESVDCYLECSSQKNKKFYEKFKFVVVGSHTIDSTSEEESTIYVMIRRHEG
jgi:GNAT superfamily N-acetyltransferase